MKKIKLLTLLMAAPMLWSCSADDPMPPQTETAAVEDPNFIPLDEAIENADKHCADFFGDNTRSSRKVENVEFLGMRTRSDSNDDAHGFYVVNYENNGGFALLSADRRRESVYAIAEEGTLHLSDTLSNRGLGWYVNTILKNPDGIAAINPGIIPPIKPPINPIDTGMHDFVKVTEEVLCKPLLSGVLTKLTQMPPYNKYCPHFAGVPSYVGSAPLCAGTIMAYYKWPKTAAGINYDWDAMYANENHDKWPRFLEMLGRPYFMNARYNVLTFAELDDLVKTFNGIIGYKNTVLSDYSYYTLYQELKKRKPVIVAQKLELDEKYEILNKDGLTFYETWIIDGGYTVTYPPSLSIDNQTTVNTYLNCVWGVGKNNGYYLLNRDKFQGAPTTPYPHPENRTTRTMDKMVYGYEIR